MTIQINTDNNLSVSADYAEKINDTIKNEIDRFEDLITRVEVYFADENASKTSENDKKCTLEARLKGKQPIAVSDNGDTYDLALDGALTKLKTVLDTIVDKMRAH